MEGRTSRIVWSAIVAMLVFLAVSAPLKIVQAHRRPTTVVTMAQLRFTPLEMTVPPGTTITFENHDVAPHTVTGDKGALESGLLTPGKVFKAAVSASVTFHCQIHPSMTGRIVVT